MAKLQTKFDIAQTPTTENYIISDFNGILVEITNPQLLSDKIRELLSNLKKIKQLGERARLVVSKSIQKSNLFLTFIRLSNLVYKIFGRPNLT